MFFFFEAGWTKPCREREQAGKGNGDQERCSSLEMFTVSFSTIEKRPVVPGAVIAAHYLGRFLHSKLFICIAGKSQAR